MIDIETLATAFIDAHRRGSHAATPEIRLSRSEILAVQARVSAALGPVAGFKVGRDPDGPPILAPIPACYGVANRGMRRVEERLGVELEVGFALLRALPSARLPARPQDYFRPHVVLELCDSRLPGSVMDRPDLKFADLQLNAGLVVGDGPEHWSGSDFGPLTARLATDGETLLDGPATVPGGSALANLDLLISHLGDHCGGLRVGQVVITGSLCGLPWVTPDTRITGSIAGLGAVCVNLRRRPEEARGAGQEPAQPGP